MTVLPKMIFPRSEEDSRAQLKREILRRSGDIGGKLFGPVPKGHRRQFFCLDEHSWIWHEEWVGPNGERKSVTTRYDVRPNGVIKMQDGRGYSRLSRDEARNLYQATKLYQKRVGDYYRQLLQTA